MSSPPDSITVGSDGYALPTMDVMTGRGFVTGKSGSGKSNTASVIAEQLLDCGLTIVIVDTDGEYFGLKQDYELLHVGGDDTCDVQVTVEHAEQLARLAVEENVPIILDVSAYLDPTEADTLIESFIRHLFVAEKTAKKPLLVLLEEVHEYIPEQGSTGDVGETLVQVAKRGRKRGLGVCGISQRPAAVDKDFITQCNWIVWHRLTWETDTQVVGRIMEPDYADSVTDLADGEAFVLSDWDEHVRRIKFKRKETFDAGATPDLDDYDPPDVRSVSSEFIEELRAVGKPTAEAAETDEEPSPPDDDDPGGGTSASGGQAQADGAGVDVAPVRTERADRQAGDDGAASATTHQPARSVAVEAAYLIAHAFELFLRGVARVARRVRTRFRAGPDVIRESAARKDQPTLRAAIGVVLALLFGLLLGGVLIVL